MNHREPPQLPAGLCKAIKCLSLALLQVMATDDATALPRTRPPGSGPEQPHAGAIPYLATVGPRALRFQTPAPPPAVRDVADALPADPTPAEDTNVVVSNEATRAAVESSGSTTADSSIAAGNVPTGPAKSSEPILRDHITPTVRAEDFLPYFQIPGSAQNSSDVTLLVPVAPAAPAPAAIPSSSATYRQTP